MCDASNHANVGPFAAVAGSIAQMTAQMISLAYNTSTTIVENGGDIYLYSNKDRIVGVLANPKEKQNIGIKIKASSCPLSFCASSSKIGHSLSFGNGDIAMVMAKNAALADALATSYCNDLKSSKDIDIVLERAQKDAQKACPQHPFCQKEIEDFLNSQNVPIKRKQEKKRGKNKETKKNNIQEKNNKEGRAVLGVFLQCDEHIGAWGELELVLL